MGYVNPYTVYVAGELATAHNRYTRELLSLWQCDSGLNTSLCVKLRSTWAKTRREYNNDRCMPQAMRACFAKENHQTL